VPAGGHPERVRARPRPGGRAARRKLGAGPEASHVLDPAGEVPVGLQIRELNNGAGVDVAIEVSGSNRGLQGAREAAGLGAWVVAAGFYQGGAANVRLGEEFHHYRLSLIASIGAWAHPIATRRCGIGAG
jgi:threonine dehydrogenase-like Zn-dependent dehydrogenase